MQQPPPDDARASGDLDGDDASTKSLLERLIAGQRELVDGQNVQTRRLASIEARMTTLEHAGMPHRTPDAGASPTGGRQSNDDGGETCVDEDDVPEHGQREEEQRTRFISKFASAEVYGDRRSEEERREQTRRVADGMDLRTIGAFSSANIPHRALMRRGLLHPTQGARLYWDITSIVLVLWICVMLPLQLTFIRCPPPGLAIMDIFIDIYFIADLCLNFRTAVELDGAELMTDPKRIAMVYLRSWFILDFASSFPIDWIIAWSQGESPFGTLNNAECVVDMLSANLTQTSSSELTQLSTLLRVLRVAKLLRLLRLARLFRILDRWREAIGLSHNLQRLGKLMFIMLMFSHWDGCLLFLVSYLEGFPDESWVVRAGLMEMTPFEQYSWAVYSAVAQIFAISFGVVDPKTISELYSFLVSLVLGATLYGFFVAALTAVLAEGDAAGQEYRRKLDKIQQYMKHENMRATLRARIRAYYEVCFPTKRAFNEDEILGELTPPLREAISRHKTSSVLTALHVLSSDRGLASAVSMALSRVVYVSGDEIIREGCVSDGLYFVQSGKVHVFKQSIGEKPLTTLGPGAFFGEMSLLSEEHSNRAVATVTVANYMEGFVLVQANYQRICRVYPEFKKYIITVARMRLERAVGQKPATSRGSPDQNRVSRSSCQRGSVSGQLLEQLQRQTGVGGSVSRSSNTPNVDGAIAEEGEEEGAADQGKYTPKAAANRLMRRLTTLPQDDDNPLVTLPQAPGAASAAGTGRKKSVFFSTATRNTGTQRAWSGASPAPVGPAGAKGVAKSDGELTASEVVPLDD